MSKEYLIISEYIFKSLNGTITEAEFLELEKWINASLENARYYHFYVSLYVDLQEPGLIHFRPEHKIGQEDVASAGSGDKAEADVSAYNDLLAQVVQRDLQQSTGQMAEGSRPLNRATQSDEENRRSFMGRRPISNRDRFVFLARFAAIILISVSVVLLDRWFQQYANQPKEIVATLTDQMDTEWDKAYDLPGDDGQMSKGSYGLESGCVHIRFKGGAELVLEGPARWTLNAEDNIHMYQGCAYARVQSNAVGFSVNTETAKIVDLGTEFGVFVNEAREVEVHVIKGEVHLIAGQKGASKRTCVIKAGEARFVDARNNQIHSIFLNKEAFARHINSATRFIWRGQAALDLADIVGGGNGFGTGRPDVGVDPATGTVTTTLTSIADRPGRTGYFSVTANPFIDGVFVPDVSEGCNVVSSGGAVFAACPDTAFTYCKEISTNAEVGTGLGYADRHLARLGGVEYGNSTNSALFMHANCGITFDLDAIRGEMPDIRLTRFTAVGGLADASYMSKQSVLWVLVDGKERDKLEITNTQANTENVDYKRFEVAIHDNDRFLTLVASDGGDSNWGDWTLFGSPEIEFEYAETPTD